MGVGVGVMGGVGMGQPVMAMGQPRMGYGGFGTRPTMVPMYGGGYGVAQQPAMVGLGYGGVPPAAMGGNRPMGAQQKLM